MRLVAHFCTMARYNRWMNDRLYAICADIPDTKRREDLGAAMGCGRVPTHPASLRNSPRHTS